MALIKCKGCGQMVSTKAENCPKCGYSVRLSMEQEQEEAKQSVETHSTTETEQKEIVNSGPQLQRKGNKKGIIIAVVVVVIIGCGVLFALIRDDGAGKLANNIQEFAAMTKDSGITKQLTSNIQKYEELSDFHEGLAAVQRNGLWGYIDKNGNEVIPCQYEDINTFDNSLAVVKKGNLYGCIDKKGNEVIPFEYEWISKYDDYFIVDKKSYGYGCLDDDGKEIAPCIYSTIYPFSDGLSRVQKDGLYGYIDKQGKEVIPCKYENASEFSDGLALIVRDGLYGFIDKQGKEVIPCKYTFAHPFSEGLAAVEVSNEEGLSSGGYIDRKGNIVIPCSYNTADGMNPFSSGLAVVMNEDGLLGCIDTKGNVVIKFAYDYIEVLNDVIITKEAGCDLYGLLDRDGKAVTQYIYDVIYEEGSLIAVVKDGKSGFIDKRGKEVIPCKYDAHFAEDSDEGWVVGCSPFTEDISIVKLNGKYGAINRQGNVIIPNVYDELHDFSDGLALAKIAGKWGYVDKNGKSTFTQDEIKNSDTPKEDFENSNTSSPSDEMNQADNLNNAPDWLQGEWVLSLDNIGVQYRLIINGSQLEFYKNKQEIYSGGFTYTDGEISFGDNRFPLDMTRHKINGGSIHDFVHVSGGNVAVESDITFRNSTDVMFYVLGKTFYGNNTRVKIVSDGIVVNGDRLPSGAPQVVRFDTDRAVIKINLIPNNEMYITVLPHEGKIVDNISGQSYFAME